MYPWLFFWAPQFHFPFSGSVAQNIEPDTQWFFDAIAPAAGNARIEKQAFEVASYGRQLGLISEVLIDLAEKVAPDSAEAQQSLQRLKTIREEIEQLKADDASELVEDIKSKLARLKQVQKDNFPALLQQLQKDFDGS